MMMSPYERAGGADEDAILGDQSYACFRIVGYRGVCSNLTREDLSFTFVWINFVGKSNCSGARGGESPSMLRNNANLDSTSDRLRIIG